MWSKTRFAILAVTLIALISLVPSARANPGVHVATPGAPFNVGHGIYITYYTDVGEDGSANVVVKKDLGSTSDLWESGYHSISGGLAYYTTAPGLSAPGTYYAGVGFSQKNCPGCDVKWAYAAFQVVGSPTPATDWAVLSVSQSPSAPQVGNPVTFKMVMTALSSSGAFPQSFSALCEIDGVSCGGGSFTYFGPTGTPLTVGTQTPWIATLGTHTLTWGVATIPVGLDPNKSNNAMSKSFTVATQAQFDFSISASPTQQSVVPGGGTSYAVTVNLVSGTAQSVALSLSTPPPAGVSVSFTPTSGTPPFSSTLSVTTTSSASPGTITLTISGIGGGASHSSPVTLIVSQAVVVSCPFASDPGFGDQLDRGFYVSSYPGSDLYTVHVQYDTNTAGTYTISMTAKLGAFNGPIIGSTQTVTVGLTLNSWTDAIYNFGGALVATGSTIAFTQVKVNGPSGARVFFNTGNGNIGNNPPGPTCFRVTETDDTTPPLSTQRRLTVGLEITELTPATTIAPDFQINVSPASQTVLQGQTVSYSVDLVGLNGFNSQVSLTVTGAPSGANTVFSVPSGTPNFASTLTVTLPASVSTGSFTLTITGNGGGQSRTANVVLTINQATQTSTQTTSTQTSGPPVGDLMGMLQQNGLLILAAVVIIALLAVVASRRRKPSGPAPAPQGPRVGTVYCPQCGAPNPVTNEFCGKCGTKV